MKAPLSAVETAGCLPVDCQRRLGKLAERGVRGYLAERSILPTMLRVEDAMDDGHGRGSVLVNRSSPVHVLSATPQDATILRQSSPPPTRSVPGSHVSCLRS